MSDARGSMPCPLDGGDIDEFRPAHVLPFVRLFCCPHCAVVVATRRRGDPSANVIAVFRAEGAGRPWHTILQQGSAGELRLARAAIGVAAPDHRPEAAARDAPP
ncbi:MAG: hypothetical protein KJ041_06165 [Gammaproteobacteria bacterium]|nr:hypothetical protein [Gammaproteobacteria bacterium]